MFDTDNNIDLLGFEKTRLTENKKHVNIDQFNNIHEPTPIDTHLTPPPQIIFYKGLFKGGEEQQIKKAADKIIEEDRHFKDTHKDLYTDWKGAFTYENGRAKPVFYSKNDLDFQQEQKFKEFKKLQNNDWNFLEQPAVFDTRNPQDMEKYKSGPLKYYSKQLGHDLTKNEVFDIVYNTREFDKLSTKSGFDILNNDHRDFSTDIKDSFKGTYKEFVAPTIDNIENSIFSFLPTKQIIIGGIALLYLLKK
jgi:hypothetical protein